MGNNSTRYADDEEYVEAKNTRKKKRKHQRRNHNHTINQIASDYSQGLRYDEDDLVDLIEDMDEDYEYWD